MRYRVSLIMFGLVSILTLTPRAEAAWLIDANAGIGIPTGGGEVAPGDDYGDFWDSGLLLGASVGYLSSPFEIGADFSYLKSDPSDDYQAFLDQANAEGEFKFFQYGVHARWIPSVQSSISPYLGVGLGFYNLKDTIETPTLEDEIEDTALGVHGRAGLNYWVSPAWGLGVDVSYHSAFPDEDEFGVDNVSFFGIAAGLRWKIMPGP